MFLPLIAVRRSHSIGLLLTMMLLIYIIFDVKVVISHNFNSSLILSSHVDLVAGMLEDIITKDVH